MLSSVTIYITSFLYMHIRWMKLLVLKLILLLLQHLFSHSLCHRRDGTLSLLKINTMRFSQKWYQGFFFIVVVPENYKLVRLNYQLNSWHQTVQNHLMPGTGPVLILLTSTGPWLWPRRHQNFSITQLSTQLKSLHKFEAENWLEENWRRRARVQPKIFNTIKPFLT